MPGFGDPVMRTASNLGGGVARWGSACGAVIGAAMGIGLIMGTSGKETLEEFEEKKVKMREITQEFNKEFEEKWGSINCCNLLGVSIRTPEEYEFFQEMKEKGETHCTEYIEWAAEKVLELLKSM
jgi:C_GCAxxG_C_C family probable redox protein